MRKFVTFILVIAIIVWNNAAFGCNCACIEEAPVVEETTVEEMAIEEAPAVEETTTFEEAEETTVIVEEETTTEETQVIEECEAFEAETFAHNESYGDYVAFDYVEEVIEEEPTTEETTEETEEPTTEETIETTKEPVIEETVETTEEPVQQTAVAAIEAVEETVEKTIETVKPVVEQAKTAYVQTGCDKLVNTFIMQLIVMLAAITALSVLLKHATKKEE